MKLPISIVALTLVALCCAQAPGTETLTGHSFGSNCTSEPCDDKSEHLEAYVVQDPSPQNYITTNFGVRISNDNFTLRAGESGPDLLEDIHFREKMMHFDHERIPERVVHARGAAAHGYFQVYEPLANYSRAAFLNDPSVQTPVFVRFSTVAGFRGSADTARDVRGFAVKFYTSEGNFDLVGNNIPVFFIQDAIKFPDIIHAAKPEPHNEIPQAQTAHDNFWDFCSLSTETAHMLMWVLSDRAIPRSYRMMEGFGVNTYALVNEQGNRTFVKFHWLPALGVHSLVWDEAQKLGGVDPDFHRRDLWEAIDKGDFPEWELAMQLVPEGQEDQFEDFDILDATKIIPVERAPLIRVGRLVLTRNPDNFFAETEQVAYCTSHLVPGIEPSNDPLLQGRMFSYFDTQLTRLGGPNFEEIPINQPIVPVTNNQRDGFHRQRIDRGTVNYFPNRYGTPAEAPPSKGGYQEVKRPVSGFTVRAVGPKFAEHFNQARLFFNSLSDWEKLHLIQAAQFELGHVIDQGVRDKMVDVFNHIDFDLAISVAQKIGVQPPTEYKGPTFNTTSGNLSQNDTIKDTIATRKIAFLVGPGYDSAQLKAISTALTTAGAVSVIIGPNLGVQNGTGDIANFTYYTTKSIQYDGLVLVGGSQYPYLKGIGEAVAFVLETFKHYKGIVAVGEGVEFLQELNLSSAPVDLTAAEGVVTESSLPSGDELMKELVAAFGFRHFDRDVTPVPAC